MNSIIKAGCILINKKNNKVALVYRKKYKDYTFPKGHIEGNETILECAIRETEEETKRIPIIDNKEEYLISNYDNLEGNVTVYYFKAKDGGKSDNSSTDTHPVIWTKYSEVLNRLSYEKDKRLWEEFMRKENII